MRKLLLAGAVLLGLVTSGHAATTRFATPATVATVAAAMAGGDTMIFLPGIYNITANIVAVSGSAGAPTFYTGMPGSLLSYVSSANDILDLQSSQTYVNITGLTFTQGIAGGTPPSQPFIYLNGASHINITNCVFENTMWPTLAILAYQSGFLRIDNNLFTNLYQGLTIFNTSGTTTYSNISVSGNEFQGMARYGMEVLSNTGGTFNNVNLNYNKFVGNTTGFAAITLGSNDDTSTGANIIGNQVFNATIEVFNKNTTIYGNTFTSSPSAALLVGHGPITKIYGNVFREVQAPFAKDGGWVQNQWIGANLENGVIVNGDAVIGANDPTIVPPACVTQQQTALIAGFPINGVPGGITPQNFQNLVCSVSPEGNILPNWYP